MPMGELYGGVVFLVALIAAHPEVRAIYWFTDCDAVKAATNSGSSPSPQMNHLLWWLFQQRAHVQLIALHIQGKRNWGADGLSRDGVEGDTIANVSRLCGGGWHGAPAAGAAKGEGTCFCCGCGAAAVTKSR